MVTASVGSVVASAGCCWARARVTPGIKAGDMGGVRTLTGNHNAVLKAVAMKLGHYAEKGLQGVTLAIGQSLGELFDALVGEFCGNVELHDVASFD